MLLTNETLPLFPGQFSSTHDRQMSCIVNIQLWLRTHFFVISMIHAVSPDIYTVLLFL
jgi:hypothetical protein